MADWVAGIRCKWLAAALALTLHGAIVAADTPVANTNQTPESNKSTDTSAKDKDTEVSPAVVTFAEKFKNISMPAMQISDVVKPGESLQYIVKWNGIPAGEATFSAKRITKAAGKKALYVSMEARSNDFLSKIYNVENKVKSYIDSETGYSLVYERLNNEKGKIWDDQLQFDYDSNQQYYTKNKDGRSVTKPSRPIPGPLQDPLSVLYYLRQFPLKVGEPREVIVATAKQTAILSLDIKREEKVNIEGVGSFDCFVIEPRSDYDTNLVDAQSNSIVVYVEKKTNIPVMVQVDIAIGKLTATLTRSSNSALDSSIAKPSK